MSLPTSPLRRAGWLAVLCLAGCYTTPTGRTQLRLVPESQMRELGEQAFQETLQGEKLSSDEALTRQVTEIGRRIAQASGIKEDWDFRLIENEQVNAFALPGGNVGVYTGILDVAETNAGLAAILAHEIGHVKARHSAERVSQVLAAQLGLVAVDQLVLRDSRYRNPTMAALGLGTQVGVLLPFSRTHESEADELGLTYMARAGYDPEAAVRLWERMAKLGGGGGPEFLSTHPDPAGRAKRLRELMPEAKRLYERSDKQPTRPLRGEDVSLLDLGAAD